jgi:low temperature requirement protein LtrA
VAALAVLVAGAFVDGQGRIVLWLLSAAIVLTAMIAAGRGEWIVRSGHFAERHALIVIIALGEVIVAIGLPVVTALEAGDGLPGRTVVALAASGVFAGLLWWAYFDRVGPALEHWGEGIEGERARGRYVRDVYTWAHAPIVVGVILAAAALEETTLHPTDDLDLAFRVLFGGGIVLFLGGIGAAIWRAFRKLPSERLLAAGVLVPVLLLGGGLDGVVLLVLVDVVVAATLVAEHVRIER